MKIINQQLFDILYKPLYIPVYVDTYEALLDRVIQENFGWRIHNSPESMLYYTMELQLMQERLIYNYK